jgi:hypothetical protein
MCTNPDLINKVEPGKRVPFFIDGRKADENSAILIGQFLMNCERGKP